MARIYVIDTDILSYAIRGAPGVIKKFTEHDKDHLCMSAISYAELIYGARRKKSSRLEQSVRRFAERFKIVDFDTAAALAYANIRTQLEQDGTPLDNMDMLIAAVSISTGAVLVTHNTKHFSKIKGLKAEDWYAQKK
jgi:tRNA(fMet)-specific endonuclease VapC